MTTNFELTATNVYQPWNTTSIATGRTRAAISTETNHPTLGQDTAALSTTSLLSKPVQGEDNSRTARVAAIGQSISAGTYFVPAYEVASSIIDSLF